MAQPFDPEDQDKPLDPAVERVRRKLVRFVAINLGLLFLALMAVVAAIVYRAGRSDEPPVAAVPELPAPAEGALVEGTIALPAGARLIGQSLAGARIGLHVALADGGQAILVYDMAERRMVGRFAIAAGD